MLTEYEIRKSEHIVTKDPMWYVDNRITSAKGDIQTILTEFIKENPRVGCCLSIYDVRTEESIDIECNIVEMPKIAEYIYGLESNNTLKFVGYSRFANCYIVGTELKGRIKHTTYNYTGTEWREVV